MSVGDMPNKHKHKHKQSQNGIGVIMNDTIYAGVIIPNKNGQSIGVK